MALARERCVLWQQERKQPREDPDGHVSLECLCWARGKVVLETYDEYVHRPRLRPVSHFRTCSKLLTPVSYPKMRIMYLRPSNMRKMYKVASWSPGRRGGGIRAALNGVLEVTWGAEKRTGGEEKRERVYGKRLWREAKIFVLWPLDMSPTFSNNYIWYMRVDSLIIYRERVRRCPSPNSKLLAFLAFLICFLFSNI